MSYSMLPQPRFILNPQGIQVPNPKWRDPADSALGSNLGMGPRPMFPGQGAFLPGVPGANPLLGVKEPKAGPNMGLLQLGLQMMMNSGRNGGGQAPLIEQMLGNPELLASIFKKKGGVQ